LQPDRDEPSTDGEHLDVAVEVRAAHVVEHDVGAVPAGLLPDPGDEVLLPVVDGDLGAELATARQLLGAASGDGDSGAVVRRKLDRHRADAARPAVHEDHLAGREPGKHEDVRPHGARDLGDACRGHEVDAARHR
jgi:hypothetical protein